MDLHLEHHCLAGQVLVIVLRECDVQVLLIAGLHADKLLLKAGHKGVGTQLQAEILALAALKRLALQEALEVDDDRVALLGLPVHAHQTGVAVGQSLQALVHIRNGDLDLLLGGGQSLVLAQGHFGIHRGGGLEGEAVAGHLALDLHRGIAHHLELLLLHGSLIGLGERDIDCLFEKHLCAVHPLDDLPGGLARAEARHVDLLAHLLICLFDGSFKLRCTDLDGQNDLALFDLFAAFHTHLVYSSVHRRS